MAQTDAQVVAALTVQYTQFAALDGARLLAFAASARVIVTPFMIRLGDRTDLALMYKTGALAAPALYQDSQGRVLTEEKGDNVQYKFAAPAVASLAADLEAQYQALLPKRLRKIMVLGVN